MPLASFVASWTPRSLTILCIQYFPALAKCINPCQMSLLKPFWQFLNLPQMDLCIVHYSTQYTWKLSLFKTDDIALDISYIFAFLGIQSGHKTVPSCATLPNRSCCIRVACCTSNINYKTNNLKGAIHISYREIEGDGRYDRRPNKHKKSSLILGLNFTLICLAHVFYCTFGQCRFVSVHLYCESWPQERFC